MRLTGSRAYYRPSPPKMPPGLVELMEGLTREVLKHNPSDVYGFCASHMHQLLEKRDGPSLKKALPLEEKIARVQEKVRLKAELRRQQYDKNVMLPQKNGNVVNNEIKDLTEQVSDTAVVVPDDVVLNEDARKSSVHNDLQNNNKRPVHQDQALEHSGEMEISQSGLNVSKPEDNFTKTKDAECGNMKTNDKPEDGTKSTHDGEGIMKTNDNINEKISENVAKMQSNYEPIVNIIANDISSHTEPCTAIVNKELINDIIPDTSNSSEVKNRRNENQQDELITDVPLDFVETKMKTEEKYENNALEYETVNKTDDTRDNLSKSSADKITKIEDVQPSSQVGDIRDSYPPINNVEQYTAKNELSTGKDHIPQSIDAANYNTASDIPKTDNDNDVQKLNDTPNSDTASDIPNSDTASDIPKMDTNKDVQNFNDTTNSNTASDFPKTDSDKDIQNLNDTSNSVTASELLKMDSNKDVQNLNDTTNSETANKLLKMDSNKDVQNFNDTSNSETASELLNMDSNKDVQNVNDTSNSETANKLLKMDNNKNVQNINDTSNSETVNKLLKTDSNKDVQNLNDTSNSETASEILKMNINKDVQNLIDSLNSDTASDIPKTDSDKDVQNVNDTSNSETASMLPKTDSNKDVQNVNDTSNSETASMLPKTDSNKDVQNLNDTSNSETSSEILKMNINKDVQNLIDYPNSDTASDIPKTDSDKNVQKLNDTQNTLQSNNTDSSGFLPENSSTISPLASPEKDTQTKGDDVNSATNNDISNNQENIENTCVNLHDITEIKIPNLEKGVDIDFQTTGIDSDIPTLVTENSGNDTHEIKISGNHTSQTVTSLENMSEVYKENASDVDYTENISTCKTNSNNVNTTQGEILFNENEINTEKQETNLMDLETAAVTIQKVFRNFLFKSRGSTFEDTTNDEGNFLDEDDKNKEECDFSIANALNIDRRAHGITRMDTVLQTVNEEKSLSLSTDDSSTLSSAATIIQAHVRGYLVRNKINSNKTISSNSLAASNSNEPSITSIEANNGSDQNKNKTILNIHIVPEGENYLSRDESLITSMDLSLDSSPPSSINLHPLGYDKSERRKQLKREDAIQSISPPSNNSGKLSEDFDSVKELPLSDEQDIIEHTIGDNITANGHLGIENGHIQTPVENGSLEMILKGNSIVDANENNTNDSQTHLKVKRPSLSKMSSDEMDVVTPYMSHEDLSSSNLMHSGEFHDAVLPTRVSRNDTSVVSGE